MEFDYVSLGENVRVYRHIAGLTQSKLSENAGISVFHISAIENAKRVPSLATIASIAKALDVKIDQLCYGEIKDKENYFVQELKQLSENLKSRDKLLAIDMTKAIVDILAKQGS